MKISRDLSGDDLVKMLCRHWSYRVVHQEGSHVVLETDDPSHQRIVVPAHRSCVLEPSVQSCVRSLATRM